MSHGHAFYFKQFKGNSLEVLRHLWVLKEYLPEEHYNNLKEAFELFNTIKDKELTRYEEETFLKYDEIYFLDNYFLHLILWDLLFCFFTTSLQFFTSLRYLKKNIISKILV